MGDRIAVHAERTAGRSPTRTGEEGDQTRELILKTARGHDSGGGGRRPVVILHVIDTGPGMNQETVEKIFQPYFTTKGGGTGLGLPTARRIIEAHDGRIDVHTEPGRGTDFVISFPAHIAK
jgi:signal transduction histidine kinase